MTDTSTLEKMLRKRAMEEFEAQVDSALNALWDHPAIPRPPIRLRSFQLLYDSDKEKVLVRSDRIRVALRTAIIDQNQETICDAAVAEFIKRVDTLSEEVDELRSEISYAEGS